MFILTSSIALLILWSNFEVILNALSCTDTKVKELHLYHLRYAPNGLRLLELKNLTRLDTFFRAARFALLDITFYVAHADLFDRASSKIFPHLLSQMGNLKEMRVVVTNRYDIGHSGRLHSKYTPRLNLSILSHV